MENIYDIANWFLYKESMSNKKLQKMCYYAQAWYAALYDDILFNERIEAWVHGPVIPTLYMRYKKYGWELIPKPSEKPSFNEKVLELLESVYITYCDLTGYELELLTHSEAPWINARKGIGSLIPSNNLISHKDMHDFYLKVYEEEQND